MINGSEQSIGHCDLPEENKMEYQHNYVDGNTAKSFENAKSESRRMTAQNHYGNPANQNQVQFLCDIIDKFSKASGQAINFGDFGGIKQVMEKVYT